MKTHAHRKGGRGAKEVPHPLIFERHEFQVGSGRVRYGARGWACGYGPENDENSEDGVGERSANHLRLHIRKPRKPVDIVSYY